MNIGVVFKGIGCFKGTFSLQAKDDVKLYHLLPRGIGYALQEPTIRIFLKWAGKTTKNTNYWHHMGYACACTMQDLTKYS